MKVFGALLIFLGILLAPINEAGAFVWAIWTALLFVGTLLIISDVKLSNNF